MPRIKKQTEHNLKLELQLDFPNKHRLVSQLIVDKEEEKEEKKASTYFHFLFNHLFHLPTDFFYCCCWCYILVLKYLHLHISNVGCSNIKRYVLLSSPYSTPFTLSTLMHGCVQFNDAEGNP